MAESDLPSGSKKRDWPFQAVLPQRFGALYERYRARGGINDVVADARAYADGERLGDISRLVFFWLAFDQIAKERIAGDIVELGVYKGQTAAVLARKARQLGRTAYLLDTFEGFDERDFEGPDNGQGFKFRDTSLDAVRARVGDENTKYIKGYFPDSAADLPSDGHYCLVHIDCDLYAPIMSSLEYFYPRMAPGGFIIVHDYSSLAWAGADKAVDTFFADKPESIVPLPDGAGSGVIRKARPLGEASNWIRSGQALELDKWYSAAHGALSDLLGEGWSGAEKWGVWGGGASHVLTCYPSDPSVVAFDIDIHVRAALMKVRPLARIDVVVDGSPYETWTFTPKENLATRTIKVRGSDTSRARKPVTIEFRPHSAERVRDLDPTLLERRRLGMALYRLRLREVSGGEGSPPDS